MEDRLTQSTRADQGGAVVGEADVLNVDDGRHWMHDHTDTASSSTCLPDETRIELSERALALAKSAWSVKHERGSIYTGGLGIALLILRMVAQKRKDRAERAGGRLEKTICIARSNLAGAGVLLLPTEALSWKVKVSTGEWDSQPLLVRRRRGGRGEGARCEVRGASEAGDQN